VLEASIATLIAGGILGYGGQRSRMCFVGGIRDRILVGDRELLSGLVSFVVTAWLLYSIAGAAGVLGVRRIPGGPVRPEDVSFSHVYQEFLSFPSSDMSLIAATVVAACVVGAVSIVSDGCPFRQHVRAGQGEPDAVHYLAGFYVGLIAYSWFGGPLLAWIGGT